MVKGIPEDELRYYNLVVFRDESGELLFNIQHDSEIDWRLPDFKSQSMDNIFKEMKPSA